MNDVYIFDAVRSPRAKGRPGGALSSLLPHQLVAQLVDALRQRTHPDAIASIDAFTLSCVGQMGAQGGHLGLVSKLEARLPKSVTTQTINNFCVGGLSAIGNAFAAVASGQADLTLAGGVEMMSHVPFLHDGAAYYTDPEVAAALRFAPVGVAADHLAVRHDVSRSTLDAYTLESHRRAAWAWDAGVYDGQVVPIHGPDGALLADRDETIRAEMTQESLDALEPVFASAGRETYDAVITGDDTAIEHRHTLAHCPPIADGASLVLLGTAEAGRRHGLDPAARVDAIVESGADEIEQLTAGEAAMSMILQRTGHQLSDFDTIEYMEAFAAVPAIFHARHDVDHARVNPNGGHLAMGHPMGATGAILTTALVHHLVRDGGGLGLTVAHGGSGVGAAAILSRPGQH